MTAVKSVLKSICDPLVYELFNLLWTSGFQPITGGHSPNRPIFNNLERATIEDRLWHEP